MKMIRHRRDFAGGVLLILFGLAGYLLIRELPYGTARRMGPAYVPTLISWAIVLMGAVLCVRSLFRVDQEQFSWRWRPLISISAAVIAFGLLIEPGGLAIASAAVVIIAEQARRSAGIGGTFLLAVAIAIIASLLFYGLLDLQIRLFPAWN